MINFTEQEWAKQQYTGQWLDNAWNRDAVARGEIPADFIGRRTYLTYEPGKGTVLLTEGYHFTIGNKKNAP